MPEEVMRDTDGTQKQRTSELRQFQNAPGVWDSCPGIAVSQTTVDSCGFIV